jgi:hypothetical protein
MRARGSYLQSCAFGCGNELAARAVHLDTEFAYVFTDLRASLYDGLVHFVFYLINDVRGSGGDKLHDVGAQLACRGVNDLELFFDADSEAVSHEVALRMAVILAGDCSSDIIPSRRGKYTRGQAVELAAGRMGGRINKKGQTQMSVPWVPSSNRRSNLTSMLYFQLQNMRMCP